MQRGSYDLLQPSQANGGKAVADGEVDLPMEMTETGTCTLKEIIEGEPVESDDKGATEGGGGAGATAADVPEVILEDSEGDDSDEEEDKEEEVKANGGEETAKASEVRVEIAPPSQGSGARGTIWQRCTFSNKCLISIVIVLALCIFFMAIAWPREREGEPETKGSSQAGTLSGSSASPASTTMVTTTPSLPSSTTTPSSISTQGTTSETEAGSDNGGSATGETNPSTEGMQPGERTTVGGEGEESEASGLGDAEESVGDGPKLEQLQQKSSQNEINRPACLSSTCRSLAANMLAFMSDDTDPCEDFYTFACGGMRAEGSQWIAETDYGSETWSRISDGMELVSESSPWGIRVFKNFYESCVSYEKDVSMETRIEKARTILKDVGEFYKKEQWDGNYGPENFTQLLGNFLIRHYSPFLDLLLDVDSSNSSKFALKLTLPLHQSPFGDSTGSISQATLSGWPREACKRKATAEPKKGETGTLDSRYKDYVQCNVDFRVPIYVEEMKSALKALHIFNDEHEWQELFPLIEDMLKNVTRIIPTTEDKTKIVATKDFKKYTLHDLLQNDNLSYVEWESLMVQLTNNTMPNDTEVQVYFESYIKNLFEEISVGDSRQWNNVLMAMFAHELYYGLVHHSACNREDYCLSVAGRLLGDAASALYLQSYLPEELSTNEKKIKSAFSDIIGTLESEISIKKEKDIHSTRALESKIQEIGLVADGGVPIFLNDNYLNKQYVEFKEEATYLENAVSLLQRYRMKMYQSYNKNPSDPEQIWFHFIDPYSNKGHAIAGLNKIVVPYGMMQRPFFSEYYPSYIQVARLGQVIAKEIWQLLSETGIQQHIPGRINEGLLQSMPITSSSSVFDSNETELFFGKLPALQEEVAIIKKKNGTLYMNDLLADGVAVYLAYRSIWKNSNVENGTKLPWIDMSPKQLYFLAIAQNSCTKSSIYDYTLSIFEDLQLPPFIRVNDISRSSREFSEAFHCSHSIKRDSSN